MQQVFKTVAPTASSVSLSPLPCASLPTGPTGQKHPMRNVRKHLLSTQRPLHVQIVDEPSLNGSIRVKAIEDDNSVVASRMGHRLEWTVEELVAEDVAKGLMAGERVTGDVGDADADNYSCLRRWGGGGC